MKRLFDFVAALLILIVTLPIWVIATLLLIVSGQNPLFFHERVGKGGQIFHLIKFRTMRAADSGESWSGITVAGDSRITSIGRTLRRWKIDELPQLLNVLAGRMSIVGPRPETPEFVALYSPGQRKILDFKPGLTDPASLKYRYEEKTLAQFADPVDAYIRVVLPDKIQISLDYQRSRTIWTDLGVIYQTARAVLRRSGIASTAAEEKS